MFPISRTAILEVRVALLLVVLLRRFSLVCIHCPFKNSYGLHRILVDSYGFPKILVDSCGFLNVPVDSWGFLGVPKDPYGS